MTKWKLKAKDFVELMPGIEFSNGKFSMWKTGERTPPLEFLAHLSRLSGIPATDLLTREISGHELPEHPITKPMTSVAEPKVPYNKKETQDITEEQLREIIAKFPDVLRRLDDLESKLRDKG